MPNNSRFVTSCSRIYSSIEMGNELEAINIQPKNTKNPNATYCKSAKSKRFTIDDLRRNLHDLTRQDVFNGVNVLKLV